MANMAYFHSRIPDTESSAITDAVPARKKPKIWGNLRNHITGLGLMRFAKDATPEEVVQLAWDLGKSDMGMTTLEAAAAETDLEELDEDSDDDKDETIKKLTEELAALKKENASSATDASVRQIPTHFWNGVSYKAGLDAYNAHLAADPKAPELSPNHFFAGVNYSVGKAAYDAYLAKRKMRSA